MAKMIRFDAEFVCGDCGYIYTASLIQDSDGVASLEFGADENCAECGSAHVEQVD